MPPESKSRASLVPTAAVIPARLVSCYVVAAKTFLAGVVELCCVVALWVLNAPVVAACGTLHLRCLLGIACDCDIMVTLRVGFLLELFCMGSRLGSACALRVHCMIIETERGVGYSGVCGEMLPPDDQQQRKRHTSTCSLVKDEVRSHKGD